MLQDGAEQAEVNVARGKTAMQRYRVSRPTALALADGLITRETSVLDYGCGRGGDVRYLRGRCASVEGWDPEHRPKGKREPADVVNLGYVLNVIEDPTERADALRAAFSLARQVLVASVRIDKVPDNFVEYGDGYLTGSNTFQKLYTQTEFRSYVEDVLGIRPVVAGLGTVYAFAHEAAEARYLATRAFARRLEYRTDLIEEFKKNKVARRYVKLANKLGRIPMPEEFKAFPELIDAFGSASRVERLTLRHVDAVAFHGSREQRRTDIATYFAMLRLQGMKPPPFATLPLSIRKDIKSIWPNYSAAVAEAMQFLFSMGQPELVKETCAGCGLGKLLPTDLYVHASAEDELPALLRLILFAARSIVGTVEWNIAKIALDGRAVSFLSYDDFDGSPHPELLRSIRVYLPRASYAIREYDPAGNPPILHRKETFVSPSYPNHAKFAALSVQEEEAGLLSQATIGTRRDWQELLRGTGYEIVGHTLARTP